MAKHYLVLAVKLNPEDIFPATTPEKLDALRRDTYNKVCGFLLAYQGKQFASFEPADTAWHQPLYHPYGVVLGTADPALFMYYFSRAKLDQKMQIEHLLLNHVFSKADASFSVETDGRGFAAYAIKPECLRSCEWVNKFMSGEFQADSVLYSLDLCKGDLSEEEQAEIMKDAHIHALCILKINTI